MKLLEAQEILYKLLRSSVLSKKQKEAVDRALTEVQITLDNGEGFDVEE